MHQQPDLHRNKKKAVLSLFHTIPLCCSIGNNIAAIMLWMGPLALTQKVNISLPAWMINCVLAKPNSRCFLISHPFFFLPLAHTVVVLMGVELPQQSGAVVMCSNGAASLWCNKH